MKFIDFFNKIEDDIKLVREKHPEVEKMPEGYIFAGCDIELVRPIAVINEVFQNKTQWSCQGHSDSRWDLAYIRFQEGHEAPKELVKRLKEKGFIAGYAQPFNDKPEVKVFIIRAFNHDEVSCPNKRMQKNKEFLKELNEFANLIINPMISKKEKNEKII